MSGDFVQTLYFKSRPQWQAQARALGLDIELLSNPPYWVEACADPFCLQLSLSEIKQIETATANLQSMCIQIADYIVTSAQSTELLLALGIPQEFHETIKASFLHSDTSLYGRFDFVQTDSGIKLLEMNFDTPTGLPETAMMQLAWLTDMRDQGGLPESADQYNFLHEKLLHFFANPDLQPKQLHFAYYPEANQDSETVKYLAELARASGLSASMVRLNQIKAKEGILQDSDGNRIEWLFKLYPWELIFEDELRIKAKTGITLFTSLLTSGQLIMVEPCYKAIFASKAILALLYQMFPDCPYLLPTYFVQDKNKLSANYVRKPFFGREGAGVSIHIGDQTVENEKYFGPNAESEDHYVYQEYVEMPQAAGYHILIGSWLINGEPAGIGLRGDKSKITGQSAIFVPHFVS